MALARRFQPYAQQAQSEAQVRFGSEAGGLMQLLSQAQSSYKQGLSQANNAAAIIRAASDHAQQQLADPTNPITHLLQRYGNAAPGSEADTVAHNLTLTADATRSMLAQHSVQAADAAKYQGTQARNQYLGDLGKIQGQQNTLRGQVDAYVGGRLQDLIGADRKQRHDANQAAKKISADFIKAGVTPKGLPIPGGPKDPAVIRAAHPPKPTKPGPPTIGGIKIASPQAHGAARDSIDYALNHARTLKATGISRGQAAQQLVNGVPGFSTKVKGATVHVQGIKSTPNLYVQAALDIAYQGSVSHATAVALHKRGLSLKELGVPTGRTSGRTPIRKVTGSSPRSVANTISSVVP